MTCCPVPHTTEFYILLAMRLVLLHCKPMKLRFCVFLCVSTALAQAGGQNNSSGSTEKAPFLEKQATVQQRGSEALKQERARSKIDLCAKAETAGNAAIGACLVAEGKTTEEEYLTYIRSIGALLQLPALGGSETKSSDSPQHLPFDAAEETWRNLSRSELYLHGYPMERR